MASKFEVGMTVEVLWYGKHHNFFKVDGITPSGMVRVMGSLYKPEDDETAVGRGETGRAYSIRIVSEEYIEKIETKKAKTAYIRRVGEKMRNVKRLTFEQAQAIDAILSGGASA